MSSTETDVTIAVVLRVEDLNTRSALAHLLQNAFLASGITSVVEQPPPPEKKGGEEAFILLATASTAAIDMEGEHLSYLKKTTSGERLEFAVSDAASFQGHGTSAFWSGAEKGELTLSIMERVVVDPAKLSPLLPSTLNEKKKSAILALPSLMHSLQHAGLVEEPFPLHNQKRRVDMWAKSMYSLYAPLDELYAYFGSDVTFYFAWMNFFTHSMLWPAALGLAMHLFKVQNGWTVDNHPYLPLYALLTVLWGMAFVKGWKRRSNDLACQWGTLPAFHEGGSGGSSSLSEALTRPEFRGELRVSDVTGKPERYFPDYARNGYYLLSVVVTGSFLALAFAVMVCSLNLQGYITDCDLWTEKAFHIPLLAKYAEPGGLFNADEQPLWCNVPVVLHVVVILNLNSLYQSIAHWLTDLENPRTQQEYADSVVLKRFGFESFDCYIALFYLAFVQMDVVRLRVELVSLYVTDSARRAFLETIIPALLTVALGPKDDSEEKAKKEKQEGEGESAAAGGKSQAAGGLPLMVTTSLGTKARADFSLPEYEQFDDYLEMVIEFGYITMFAGSFPLAPLLSYACNLIELKSDCYKITRVVRRPQPERAGSIGQWGHILQGQAYLAVVTNLVLFAMASNQMKIWVPSLFLSDPKKLALTGGGIEAALPGSGRYVIGLMVLLEHAIFLGFLAVNGLVSDTTPAVNTEVRRLAFVKDQAARELRRQASSKAFDAPPAAAAAAAAAKPARKMSSTL